MAGTIRDPRLRDAALLLFVSILVTSLWFSGGSLALGGDYSAIPLDPQNVSQRYLIAWNYWNDAGNPISSVITNLVPPVDFLFFHLNRILDIPLPLAQELYVILFSYFLGSLSTYFLIRTLFDHKIKSPRLAGIIGGIFYILNPIYVYSTGYTFILGSAIPRASLPLALFLLVQGFMRRDQRYAVAFGLSMVLAFSVFARGLEFGFLVIIATALGLPHLGALSGAKRKATLLFAGKFLGIAAFVALTTNLFWIVPFAQNLSTFQATLVSFPTSLIYFQSQFTTLMNLFRLQGYWTLYVGDYVPYASYFESAIAVAASFAIPIIALSSLALRRSWPQEMAGLGIAAVSFLALGLGTNLPFRLFESLIAFVPFFKLFKDPWVFLEPLSLVYSILFAVSFAHVGHALGARVRKRTLGKCFSLVVATLLLATVSAPVFTGEVYTNWYQPSQKGVTIPSEYTELNTWLMEQSCDCATLVIPKLSGAYMATDWGYQGANALYQNLLSTRLITGSGPPIYGLQPSHTRAFVDYVYTLLSSGDPLYAPTPFNETIDIQRWKFAVDAQSETDSILASDLSTPWNDTALRWAFEPLSAGASNGHNIYMRLDTAVDLTTSRWLLLWAASTSDWSNFHFGIGDTTGQVGWYSFRDHLLRSVDGWDLFGFPLKSPDARQYDPRLVQYLNINFGIFQDPQTAAMGTGVVDFGRFYLSSGAVSERLVQFLLRVLNVGYIVMDPTMDHQVYPQLDVKPYEEIASRWSNISIAKRFGNLTVFENPDAGLPVIVSSHWFEVSNILDLPAEMNRLDGESNFSAFLVANDTKGKVFESSAELVSIEQLSATEFKVRVVADGTFLLVLSTAFDSEWSAKTSGGAVVSHLIASGYANGWLINGTGDLIVSISYEPQFAFNVSVAISVSSILAAFAVMFSWRQIARVRLRLLQKPVREHED